MKGCWWRGHDWGKWEPCTIRLTEEGEYIAHVTGQLRECKRCGWEKIRKSR